MSIKPISRRHLLKMGSAALAAPFIRLDAARADTPGLAKRLIIFHHPQGTVLSQFAPVGSGSNYTLPFILQPLEHLRDRITILTGIDNAQPAFNSVGNAHDNANYTVFTGQPYLAQVTDNLTVAGPTIDQVIATRLAAPTPFPRLDFVVGGDVRNGVTQAARFFAGPYDRISGYNDPMVALLRIFGDDTLSPAEQAALQARRSGVLDAVLGNFQRMRTTVPVGQQERLDVHLSRVEELHQRISLGTGACIRPSITTPPVYDPSYDDDVTAPLMADIAVAALACDYTRVATFAFANGHDHTFPWLTNGNGNPIVDPAQFDNWHAMVHADFVEGMQFVYRWYQQQFADFLDKLAAEQDVDGDNLLDTSLVVYMPEFSSGRHFNKALPVILAGCVPSAGQYFDFMGAQRSNFLAGNVYGGDSEAVTNQLFVSLLQAFGQSDTTFGNLPSGYATGGLPGVF